MSDSNKELYEAEVEKEGKLKISTKEKGNILNNIMSIGIDKLLIIAVCGVALVILSMPSGSKEKKGTESKSEKNTYTNTEIVENASDINYIDSMEKKLKAILEKMEGVGRAEVVITQKDYGMKKILTEKNEERIVEKQNSSDSRLNERNENRIDEKVVYEENDGNQIPFVQNVMYPEINGVAVVCQGGDNPVVISKVTDTIKALFGIPIHKISVTGLSK